MRKQDEIDSKVDKVLKDYIISTWVVVCALITFFAVLTFATVALSEKRCTFTTLPDGTIIEICGP